MGTDVGDPVLATLLLPVPARADGPPSPSQTPAPQDVFPAPSSNQRETDLGIAAPTARTPQAVVPQGGPTIHCAEQPTAPLRDNPRNAHARADLLQFTSGGHVLGFAPREMYAASGSHAPRVEFVDAEPITPQSDSRRASDASQSETGRVAPLAQVTYPNLWRGITLSYDAPGGGDTDYCRGGIAVDTGGNVYVVGQSVDWGSPVRAHSGSYDAFVAKVSAAPPPPPAQRKTGLGADVGDPISANSGSYHFELPLLNLGGLIPLESRLTYHLSRAGADESGLFHGFLTILWRNPSGGVLIDLGDNGDQLLFSSSGGGWSLSGATRRYVLTETGSDEYTGFYYLMDPIEERILVFEKRSASEYARLRAVMDRKDNRLIYAYSGSGQFPDTIYEGDGATYQRRMNVITTTINGKPRVTGVTEQLYREGAWQDGRRVAFGFGNYGAKDLLNSVTDPLRNTTRFDWEQVSGVSVYGITKMTLPNGNAPYSQTIAAQRLTGDDWARVITQTDAYGNATTLAYDSGTNRVTESRPDGRSVVYEHAGNFGPPKSLGDPLGNQAVFTVTTNNQVSSFRDRSGETTRMTYHAQTGKLASITNAKNEVISYTYSAQTQNLTNPISPAETVVFTFYNLTGVDYPDQSKERFDYDARGNLLTYTNRINQVWQYQYNSQGQVTRITHPTGGTVEYRYNADRTLASCDDSETGITTFGYDIYKRPVTITHPSGALLIAYNLNDQVAAITNERGKTYAYEYDANGNLTRVTDPAGKRDQYTRDLMNRVSSLTNRLGVTIAYTYDAMNRLTSVTDPLTNTTQLAYDPRGWLNRTTDPAGKVWQTDYDAEGLVDSRTTPLSRTTRLGRDPLGYLTAITNPLGDAVLITRDAMSRITAIADPLGRQTSYSYDSQGLLTHVALPDLGQATYDYNNLGLLSSIRDFKGSTWAFGYTPLGRLQTMTDPLNRATQYAYDHRGLLQQVIYPDSTTQTRAYDAAGNLTRRQYAGGPDLQFAYDDLNRLIATEGISLTYNEVGQVTATTDPATGSIFRAQYDAAGRLESVDYAGLFSVTYQYDSRGRLTRAGDSLTGAVITFAYDDDGRLTGIQHSNGVSTTLTWDAASRLSRLQEGSVADMRYDYNAAGEIVSQACTLPLDPDDYLVGGSVNLSYDAASQIDSTGYAHDARGRLTTAPSYTYTWDGASRLIGYQSTVSNQQSIVQLSYSGFGDLLTRTEGATTTRYFHNYALGLAPIVAERNDTAGQMQRYYVWTPDGRLLHMIDAADNNKVYFYHFDRSGSTLALTDRSGAVTDKYAYDPHGKLLAHQGSNTQPFTFLGQWGVRQEGASGARYHMRARYYDATTARFLSREPLWPHLADPRQINPYQYARNDPIGWVDITGTDESSSSYPKRVGVTVVPAAGTQEDDFWVRAVHDTVETQLVKANEEANNGYGVYETDPSKTKEIAQEREYSGKSDKSPEQIPFTVFVGRSPDDPDKIQVLIMRKGKGDKIGVVELLREISQKELERGEPTTFRGSGRIKRNEDENRVEKGFGREVALEFIREVLPRHWDPAGLK